MALSQRNYVEIAAIVLSAREEFADDRTAQRALEDVAAELASYFKRDNGRFSYTRFFNAAGLPVPLKFAGASN